MTYIKQVIGINERTVECPDWARHSRLRDVAREAFTHIACTEAERAMHVECCLVVVAAKRPPTFEVAAAMVRQLAWIKTSYSPSMTDDDIQLEDSRKQRRRRENKRIDEAAEVRGDVRGAIAEHAAAEREWDAARMQGRGNLLPSQERLERMARDAFIKAEKNRARG